MEELLKMINELAVSIRSIATQMSSSVVYAHNITNEANAKIKSAEDKEKAVASKLSVLEGREKAVGEIENLVTYKHEAEALMKKIEADHKKLEDNIAVFNKQRAEELAKITSAKKENENEAKRLAKLDEDLKAKAETYKKEITEKLTKAAK